MITPSSWIRNPAISLPWLLLLVGVSCSGLREIAVRDPCTLLDSLRAGAFLEAPYVLEARASLDVRQYRIKGRMRISAAPDESGGGRAAVVLDFTGSSYFGGHREDMTIIVRGAEVTILDRERGNYLEGEEAEDYIAGNLGLEGDVAGAVGVALGNLPSCAEMEGLKAASDGAGLVITGRRFGERVALRFLAGGRIGKIDWPLDGAGGRVDRAEIEYVWDRGGSTLKKLKIRLAKRAWRMKFDFEG